MVMKITKKSEQEYVFELTGGRLCLDFVNTVSGKRGANATQRLNNYRDLVSWSRQVGIFDQAEAKPLLTAAQQTPQQAEKIFREAIELRESLYRLFTAAAERSDPSAADLSVLNAALARSLVRHRLEYHEGRYSLNAIRADCDLDCMLWPIAKSAAELITSEKELERIRVCEATAEDRCDWIFLDETRNRTRRWCSMKDCGNRAKARRFYQRHHASTG